MNTKLYVGNLSYDATENDLQDAFAAFGTVTDVNLITDRATGRSRGFAFVTFANPEAAKAALDGLQGKDVKGRALKISEAREREERSGGGGGGGGGGRGGYGGGGGGGGGGGRDRGGDRGSRRDSYR
jgi:cold-inducible RNA-binding protein